MYATRFLLVSSFLLALVTAPSAHGEYRRIRRDRDRMPGWDAARIYPWSPYNYGRNPYNPIIVNYPPPYYPSYRQPEDYGSYNTAAPDGAVYLSSLGQTVNLPQPSGALKVPPPGAAIIQVRVPTTTAHVLFDGERTYTDGTTRYFVTPELPDDKTCHYVVSASWKNGDDETKKERTIQVKAGHTTVVDFTRPVEKKSP